MLEEENELVEPTDPPDNQNNAATPDLNLDLDSVEEEPSKADPPDNQRSSGG